MSKQKLHDWIQIIGTFAVVASLAFVGLQLSQSQKIAIAAQYQARLEAASSHYAAILQSEPGLSAIGKDIAAEMLADETLPPELQEWVAMQPVEELAFRMVGGILFLKSHDNVYFQYQEGFLSEEGWLALRMQLKDGLKDPRSWATGVYKQNPYVWRESFRDLVEELINEP
jgi:hypothetical protein